MQIDINRVKITITAPIEYVDTIREAACNKGAGVMGNYTHCSMSMKCVGTFKPNENANPFIGEVDRMEVVDEEHLDIICQVDLVKDVLAEIRRVHPYEEPGIFIVPLIDEDSFK
jgi:hypothetical protein